LNACSSSLAEWSSKYPHLHYIFHPTFERLSSEEALHLLPEPLSGEKSISSVEALLNALLHSVQVIVTEISKTRLEVTEGIDLERRITEVYRETRNLTHLLSTNGVLEQLGTLLSGISTARELQHALHCTLPFLEIYQNLVQAQIAIHTRWTKALFKLDHVLCSTLLRLSKEGFCQPPETIEDGDGTGELLEDVEGTGLGEGSGTDNISKEIEDESQVEGLKGEDQEKKNQEGDDDNAVEMTEDFGGALEDVADGGLEEDNVDESDASDNEDPEERLEDLDPTDPSALDEKIWGDEGGPQDDTKDKSRKDHSEEQNGSSEVVAKENNEKPQKEKGGTEEETEGEVEQKEEDQEAQATEDQTKDEEGEPSTAGAPMPDYVQDTNILDIPDDIELDVGEEEQKSTSDEELDRGGEDRQDEKFDDVETGDESLFDDDLEGSEHRDSTLQDNDTTPVDQVMEMNTTVEENVDEDHAKEESIPEEATVHSDVSPGNGDADGQDSADGAEAQGHFTTGQTIGSAVNAGQRSTNQENFNEQTECALFNFLLSLFITLA